MDPSHERLARIGLAAGARYGFCLAGGYAVRAHGFVDRPSKDVDLFTAPGEIGDFAEGAAAVIAALRAGDLLVDPTRQGTSFTRLEVTDRSTGETAIIELGVDWRAYPPVSLEIGPVLHPDDAVANKVCALFSRAAVRGLHRRK